VYKLIALLESQYLGHKNHTNTLLEYNVVEKEGGGIIEDPKDNMNSNKE